MRVSPPSGPSRAIRFLLLIPVVAILTSGCGVVRLGGPRDLELTVTAILAPPGAGATAIAARLPPQTPALDIVLADEDEAWFRAALGHSAPTTVAGIGTTGGAGIAARGLREPREPGELPPLRVPPPLAPPLRAEAHHRLGSRRIYLLVAEVPAGGQEEVREAATLILARIASEAPGDALVLLVVKVEESDRAGELDRLVGEYLLGPGSCSVPGPSLPRLRLYRAPAALSTCLRADAVQEMEGVVLRLSTRG